MIIYQLKAFTRCIYYNNKQLDGMNTKSVTPDNTNENFSITSKIDFISQIYSYLMPIYIIFDGPKHVYHVIYNDCLNIKTRC